MDNQNTQKSVCNNVQQPHVCPCCGRCPLCGQPNPQFVPYNPWYYPMPVPYITSCTPTFGAAGADLTGASGLGGEAFAGMQQTAQDGHAQIN
jgi:hypothetical protein